MQLYWVIETRQEVARKRTILMTLNQAEHALHGNQFGICYRRPIAHLRCISSRQCEMHPCNLGSAHRAEGVIENDGPRQLNRAPQGNALTLAKCIGPMRAASRK